jgi:type II secretory pathway pseudopilin PulG
VVTLVGILLGLAVVGGVLLFLLAVSWVRWKTRERRTRRLREQRRAARREDDERARRQLRLRVSAEVTGRHLRAVDNRETA